ncbi:MAG: peptidase MA family metallohydrolase [Candidatus Omnitrophota bacterium]
MMKFRHTVILVLIFLGIFLGEVSYAVLDDNWRITKGNHFIISFRQEVPEKFVLKTLEYAEKYYQEITENLGFSRENFWLEDNRARIYIYKDSQEYLKATGMPDWSAGTAIGRHKIIETYASSINFFDNLLPHELAHIIFREFINQEQNVPLWLDEGVAQYMEKTGRSHSKKIIKDALNDNTFFELTDLAKIDIRTEKDDARVHLFYAESLSVVDFLIKELAPYRFCNFSKALRRGASIDDALKAAYQDASINNLDDLGKVWKKSLLVK